MENKVISKRRYKSASSEVIIQAIEKIKNGEISINKCAKKYNIAKGTLINALKGRHQKNIGRPTVFSVEDALVVVNEWGYPFDSRMTKIFAKTYLDGIKRKVSQFGKDNTPGNEWLRSFLRRNHVKLSMRFCQNLKLCKAELSEEVIANYFDNLKDSLTDKSGDFIPPERIFNFDETNLTDDPGVRKFIFKKGVKYPNRIMDSSKSSTSVMFCGSASGKLIPPYVVYQATHLWTTWINGGPNKTRYNRTKSGWFDGECFKDWFLSLFIPETRHLKGSIVVIGDNLASHFSLEVIKAAVENDIRFVCLPTNATHLCQPLDVAFYGPLKKKWRLILDNHKNSRRKNAQHITKENFPAMLKILVQNSINEDGISNNLISGFVKCGISPFNPSKVLECIPSVSNDQIQSSISSAVETVLSRMLNTDQPSPSRKRKSKLNIVPGKSIVGSDIIGGNENLENVEVSPVENIDVRDEITEEEVVSNLENVEISPVEEEYSVEEMMSLLLQDKQY